MRACLIFRESAAAPARFRSCRPMCDGTPGCTSWSDRPGHPALDLQSYTIDGDRRCIWFQLGHSLKIRSIFLRLQRPRRLRRRRLYDNGRRQGRLAGVQDDFFRPFAVGSDPDGRPFDNLRPIGKTRREFRQSPAGDQQKKSKRASDHHKISGYGHRRQLPRLEQSRPADDSDACARSCCAANR
jgi:hypothetical protein